MYHNGSQAVGWGIHIIEGPDGMVILWLTVATILVSFILAVLWAVFRKDVQGAFGIAAFVVASESALAVSFFNFYPIQRGLKL